MKPSGKLFYLLSLLLIVANVYIFLNRNAYLYIKQSSYNELYQPFAGKGIKDITISGNKATLYLAGFNNNITWKIKADSLLIKEQRAPLEFELKENLHKYTFIPDDTSTQPFICLMDYSRGRVYEAAGNSASTNTALRYCSLPFISYNNKWNYTYNYIPDDEIAASEKILQQEVFVNENDADTVKFKKIARFVYTSLKPYTGIPPDSLLIKTPYGQFKSIRAGNTKVWCSNFSILLNYFCTLSGLKIRPVGFLGPFKTISLGSHAANEIYISELGGWVYTDLTNNMIFVKDQTGNYLNTADILYQKSLPAIPALTTFKFGEDSIYAENISNPELLYGGKETELLFPYEYNPAELYSLPNKVNRYLTEDAWFEVYTNKVHYSNKYFYLKQFLFFSLVVSLGLSVLVFLWNKKIK